jgi:hypothetical protein
MTHDSTWLGGIRAMRWMRLTVPVGLLLAGVLLAGLPAAALAAAPEMRGEWELVIPTPDGIATGKALISVEANPNGEFASSKVLFAGAVPGTFSGTLEGSKASVTATTEAYGPFQATQFTSTTMAIEPNGGSLSMSGYGTLIFDAKPVPMTKLVATRIRTYKQIEEQEAKEKLEKEEKEARANVRGEWELTLEDGSQPVKGTALITQEASPKNAFASASALFEMIPGTFSGTLKGDEASVTITTQEVPGVAPAGGFTGTGIVVTSSAGSMSMTGPGTLTLGTNTLPGKLTATRIKTYREVIERETKEREAKEEEQAATEQKAREQKEKEQKEKEQKEKELKERQEREAREAAEKAAAAKTLPGITPGNPTITPLVSALLATKTLVVGNGGAISLDLTNPNSSPVEGDLKLTLAKTGKTASVKHTTVGGKSSTLGETAFSITAHGSEVVKVKLSRSGRTELARRKILHVVMTLTTQASGQPSTSKAFDLTLHAAKPAHGKH